MFLENIFFSFLVFGSSNPRARELHCFWIHFNNSCITIFVFRVIHFELGGIGKSNWRGESNHGQALESQTKQKYLQLAKKPFFSYKKLFFYFFHWKIQFALKTTQNSQILLRFEKLPENSEWNWRNNTSAYYLGRRLEWLWFENLPHHLFYSVAWERAHTEWIQWDGHAHAYTIATIITVSLKPMKHRYRGRAIRNSGARWRTK